MLQCGNQAEVKTGNVLPVKNIPDGTAIFSIELQPGDGGKFVRSSGSSAKVVGKTPEGIVVKLPSNKSKTFNPECRACIGVIAGSGRVDKPMLKAGVKHFAKKAKNKYYPIVSGVSMNAVAHPFGSKCSHTKGRPTQAARNDPPGRKVGSIAPRRSGWKR
jgi:large subunit ribosomal protein L2